MSTYAEQEWQRAKRTLETARMVRAVDADSSVSRAYYAAFHAVSALFALRGQEFTKHAAVRAAVHRELVKEGVWSVELGKDFDFLMEMRDVGDYGGVAHVTEEDADATIERAERIVQAVQRVLSGEIAP